jgi:hypothetical protein
VSTPSPQQVAKIDGLMEQAHKALVSRRYFECEALSASALRKAHALLDYDRMARILMPLQEARRQKRDLALDAGAVRVVEGEMPAPEAIGPGCWLVGPPRVGVDGRALREAADARGVAVVVVVREPTSRDGLWPVVAVGPVTVRAKVEPAELISVEDLRRGAARRGVKKKVSKKAGAKGGDGGQPVPKVPAPEWFIQTNEALGDAAIASVDPALPAHHRVDLLLERLEALPDHEKLHQALERACREALREPLRKRKPSDEFYEADEFADDEDEA